MGVSGAVGSVAGGDSREMLRPIGLLRQRFSLDEVRLGILVVVESGQAQNPRAVRGSGIGAAFAGEVSL